MTEKTEHPHAWVLRAIADGEPLYSFEVQGVTWDQRWACASRFPSWTLEPYAWRVRRKQKTILVNGIEVPEPVREPLEEGEVYWLVGSGQASRYTWIDDAYDRRWLEAGLIQRTEEGARAQLEAILLPFRKQ